jgi:DNA-binding transcriptional MerR regulator
VTYLSDENLYSLKEIAAQMNMNWQTLRSWKEQFYTHIPMIRQGRQTKYKSTAIQLFFKIREMKEAGQSDSQIHEKLENYSFEEKTDSPAEPIQLIRDDEALKGFQTTISHLQEEISALKAKLAEEKVALRDYELMDQLRQIRESKKHRTSLFRRIFRASLHKS